MNPALIAGIVAGAVMSGTSLLYATLGEIVGERAGIVNLGLEGIMLIGASSGFAATALTGSPYLGIAAAAVAGGLELIGYLRSRHQSPYGAPMPGMDSFGAGPHPVRRTYPDGPGADRPDQRDPAQRDEAQGGQ